MKRILCLLVAVGVVLMISVPKAQADDSADLYKSKCQMCHGPDGKGSPVGLKMGAHDWHAADVMKMTDAQLTDIINKGKNKMPAFTGKLTADQVKGLVAYIHALQKK